MAGIAVLTAYMLLGLITARRLFSSFGRVARVWIGLVLGLVEMMWLPAAYAFLFGFTLKANWWALFTSLGLAACSFLIKLKRPDGDDPPLKEFLWLALPIIVLSAYLQYTHTLMPVNGDLYVGQSTYGDLCLHLGIATGLRNAPFPPEYTILPGTTLGYPFLFDALSTTMMLFGTELRWAFIVPGVIAMALVYWGFLMLAWEMTRDRRAVALAFLLAFLNGGLGFIYVFDGWPQDMTRIWECFFGFYRAPANMPDYNLRWVNVVCDLMVPQRTLLAGWMVVLPALYMLLKAIKGNDRRMFLTLGAWAGLMPMIHTHSFLALGLISAGAMLSCIISERDWREYLKNFVLYALVALAVSAWQLVKWTFPQSLGSGQMGFIFNWVNNAGNGALIDGYFWFWIKNVGPVYILMLPAALNAPKRLRHMALGALMVYIAAEIVQFQPNIYDNNKLFYVAFFAMLPMVGKLLSDIWTRLRGVKTRGVLAFLFLAVCFMSGAMSLGREAISSYRLISKSEAEAAEYVEKNLPTDCVILTGTQHNNPISSLAGRKIVCGTPSYLYYHGVNYEQREADVEEMYEFPDESRQLFKKYNVDYIYISSSEAGSYDINDDGILAMGDVVFENEFVMLVKLDETAVD